MKYFLMLSLLMLTSCATIHYDTAYTFEYGSDKIYINDPPPIFEDTLQTTPGNYRGYIWIRCNY